ncbi:MAG: hypothetical protein H6799_02835 [Candidatus Nomurabacteria bacterium]|nr:MAG: hypothetical protein H6799_02835 [Candidatus Nomurabacteria bacterium]
MEALLFFSVIFLIGLYFATTFWSLRRMRPIMAYTTLSRDRLKDIFRSSMTRWGWKVIDQSNPIIAQSSFLTGRQGIAMTINEAPDGRLKIRIQPRNLKTNSIPDNFGYIPQFYSSTFTIATRIKFLKNKICNNDPSITFFDGADQDLTK